MSSATANPPTVTDLAAARDAALVALRVAQAVWMAARVEGAWPPPELDELERVGAHAHALVERVGLRGSSAHWLCAGLPQKVRTTIRMMGAAGLAKEPKPDGQLWAAVWDEFNAGVRQLAPSEGTGAHPVRDPGKPSRDRQEDIISAIRSKGTPLTRSELVEALRRGGEGALGRNLAWMVKNELLVNIPGRGYWPASDPTPV